MIAMNCFTHRVPESLSLYRAFSSSLIDLDEECDVYDVSSLTGLSFEETSSTRIGRSAIDLLLLVWSGGGSGGGGGTRGWLTDSMTVKIFRWMGSHTGEVVREDTGSREGVVAENWSFGATIG